MLHCCGNVMTEYFKFFTDDFSQSRRYVGSMDGTIYDDCTTPLFAFDGVGGPARSEQAEPSRRGSSAREGSRVAVISNPRSYRNKRRPLTVPSGVLVESPRTRHELRRTLASFKHDGIELVIVAGGDGTVRDVLTCGTDVWGDSPPVIGVLPCGKTNALAIDLGVPDDWDISQMVAAWKARSFVERPPIEIERVNEGRPVLGYLFGAGVFVDATDLAQTTHRFGAVNNLAVALSIFGAVASTIMGGNNSAWRQGKAMAIRYGEDAQLSDGTAANSEGQRFIVLASTMERLPLGLKIFGERRPGMKTLVVDAPPRRFMRVFTRVLRGMTWKTMADEGVHRVDTGEMRIDLEGGFILDGERFPAGDYLLRKGAPVTFVTS